MTDATWRCPKWAERYRELLLGALPQAALEQIMRGDHSLDRLPPEWRRPVEALMVIARCDLLDSLHRSGALGVPVADGEELQFLCGPWDGKLKPVPRGMTRYRVCEAIEKPSPRNGLVESIALRYGHYRLKRLVLDGKTASVMAWEGWE